MTGGAYESGGSVEVLKPNGTPWCSLPNLPHSRYLHTQSGLVTCGGGGFTGQSESCVTFNKGEWINSHILMWPRDYHTSWFSKEKGIFLIGGSGNDSEKSTEMLLENGESLNSFPLKYGTR